jgi:DNA-binding NtrC family response regulator
MGRDVPPPPAALVVEPVLPHLLSILSALSVMGLDVTVAETFKDARDTITSSRPSLLLTDVRLQDYNGLHLVLRGRSVWSELPAIVTSGAADAVLQDEAEKLGATFLVMPASTAEIVAAIYRTLFRPDASGRLAPIRPPFERRHAERRASASMPFTPNRRVGDRRRSPGALLEELAAMG